MDYITSAVLVFCVLGTTSALNPTWPRSVAATLGDDVILNCRPAEYAEGTSSCTWMSGHYADVGISAFYMSASPGGILSGYSVNESSPYDLTIDNIALDKAGTYYCSLPADDATTNHEAEVVFIRNFGCAIETEGSEEPAEGDVLTFSCTVDYYGSEDYAPELDWIVDGSVVPNQEPITRVTVNPSYSWRTVVREYNTTASVSNGGKVYSCSLFWADSMLTGNYPLHTDTCTKSYNVPHSLTNMHIQYNGQTYTTGRLLYVTAGSSITCTVSAYPAACLGWEKVTGSGPTIPQVDDVASNVIALEITSDMDDGSEHEYDCVATQATSSTHDNMVVKFTVGAAPSTDDNGGNAIVQSFLLVVMSILLTITQF